MTREEIVELYTELYMLLLATDNDAEKERLSAKLTELEKAYPNAK